MSKKTDRERATEIEAWIYGWVDEIERLERELAEARKLLREANAAVRHSAWWRYGSDVTMPCVVDRIDAFLEREP